MDRKFSTIWTYVIRIFYLWKLSNKAIEYKTSMLNYFHKKKTEISSWEHISNLQMPVQIRTTFREFLGAKFIKKFILFSAVEQNTDR